MSDLWIRVIAGAFGVAGFMYGHKKGYSLRAKTFLALVGVLLLVVVGGIMVALIWPESVP